MNYLVLIVFNPWEVSVIIKASDLQIKISRRDCVTLLHEYKAVHQNESIRMHRLSLTPDDEGPLWYADPTAVKRCGHERRGTLEKHIDQH